MHAEYIDAEVLCALAEGLLESDDACGPQKGVNRLQRYEMSLLSQKPAGLQEQGQDRRKLSYKVL